jgi:hypothetical protein
MQIRPNRIDAQMLCVTATADESVSVVIGAGGGFVFPTLSPLWFPS